MSKIRNFYQSAFTLSRILLNTLFAEVISPARTVKEYLPAVEISECPASCRTTWMGNWPAQLVNEHSRKRFSIGKTLISGLLQKSSYFYKTRNGARVGDLYMSLIHTHSAKLGAGSVN